MKTKKDLSSGPLGNPLGGIATLMGEIDTDNTKSNQLKKKIITKTSQEGTKENETRATFIVNEDLLEKIKAMAYWERKLLKDIINSSIEDTLAKYIKKNGEIVAIPKK